MNRKFVKENPFSWPIFATKSLYMTRGEGVPYLVE